MITITLQPAIDLTVRVDALVPGEVHRATVVVRQAGGKGLNVSTMLALGGTPSVALGFLGTDNADFFASHCARLGIHDGFIRLPGETRTGIKIVEAQRRTTELNFNGPGPTAADLAALGARWLEHLRPGEWVVLAGRLPEGVRPGWVTQLVGDVRAAGGRIAVDTSGAALAAAVAARADLIKPNRQELEELLGRPLPDLAAARLAARELRDGSGTDVVLSLGADGAWFCAADGEVQAVAPQVDVVSTVGAGDALLAGYLQARGQGADVVTAARLATVYAAARLAAIPPVLPTGAALTAACAAVRLTYP